MAAASSCTLYGNVGVVGFSSQGGNSGTQRNTVMAGPRSSFPRLDSFSALRMSGLPRSLGKASTTPSRSLQGRPLQVAGQAVAEVEYLNSGEEAKKLVDEQGFQIVDIRDEVQYKRAHIPTAVHIPYFIINEDNDILTIIYRQLHFGFSGLFYGVAYTKQNPDFMGQVMKKFPDKGSKLLLMCNEGLRSGYAAEKLGSEGYQNLAYLSTGLQKVQPGIFPKEGKSELKDGGKGGLVTVQGRFSFALGTLLILAYLFLQFFPDQANELFFKTTSL